MTPGRLLLLMLVCVMSMDVLMATVDTAYVTYTGDMTYAIYIDTSDIAGAGSEASGFLRMYGKNSLDTVLHLTHEATKGSQFIRGGTYNKEFADQLDIGEIHKVALWHDGTGTLFNADGPGWNVNELRIVQLKGSKEIRETKVYFNDLTISTTRMVKYPYSSIQYSEKDEETKSVLTCDNGPIKNWKIQCPTQKRIQIESVRYERLKQDHFCTGSRTLCTQPKEKTDRQKEVIQVKCEGRVDCEGYTHSAQFNRFGANACIYGQASDRYLKIEYTCQKSVSGEDGKTGCVKLYSGFCDKEETKINEYRIGDMIPSYTLQDCHTECAKKYLCEAFAHINDPKEPDLKGECHLFRAGCEGLFGNEYIMKYPKETFIPANSNFYEMRSCSKGFIDGKPQNGNAQKCGPTFKQDCEVATFNRPKSCCSKVGEFNNRCSVCDDITSYKMKQETIIDYRTYYQVVTNPRPGDKVTRGPGWTDGNQNCKQAIDLANVNYKKQKSKKEAKALLKEKKGKTLEAASNQKVVPPKRATTNIKPVYTKRATSNTPQHMKRAINSKANYMKQAINNTSQNMKRDESACDAKKATGEIIANNGNQMVEVRWDSGYVDTYSVGKDGEYDLYYDGNKEQYSCVMGEKGDVWQEDPGATDIDNLNNSNGRFRKLMSMKKVYKNVKSHEMCIRKCYFDPEVLWDTVKHYASECSCYFRKNDDSMETAEQDKSNRKKSYSCRLRRGGQMTELKLQKCVGDECTSMEDVPKAEVGAIDEDRKGYVYIKNGDSSIWRPICVDTENTGAHSVVASLMCRQIYNEQQTSGEYKNIKGEFKQPTNEIKQNIEMTNVMCTENAPISVSQRFMDCKWETKGKKECKNGLVYVQCTRCDKAKYLALMKELDDEFEILMNGAQKQKGDNQANENDQKMADTIVEKVSQEFMDSKNQDLGKAVIIILETKLKKLAKECYDWACDYPQEITAFHCRFKSWMMALKESMAPSSTDMGIILANREHRELLKHDFALQNFKNIGNEVKDFRKSMGSYFAQLATFDLSKAEQDKGYVKDTIKKIHEKMTTTFKELSQFLNTAVSQAQVVSNLKLVEAHTKTFIQLATFGNPFKWILGDPIDAMESVDALSNAYTQIGMVAKVKHEIMNLGWFFQKLQDRMVKNKANHDNFLNLIDMNQDITSEEMVEISKKFTDAYGAYSPGLTPELVTEYTTKLEMFADKICEATNTDSTITNAGKSIDTAFRGTPCFKDMHVTIAKMIAFLEQMMDLQDDMMDAGADMARALIARSEAKRIIGDTDVESNQHVLLRVFEFVPHGLLRWEPYLRAYTHRRELVASMCHEMKYRNFGNTPVYCKNLHNNPVPEDISQLISWKYIEPVCSTRVISIHGYANEANALGDTLSAEKLSLNERSKGIEHKINVKALYETGETTFEIMDVKTARQMGWIDPSSDGVGVYVKQFALYLPPEEDDKPVNLDKLKASYKVEVDIFKSGGENFLKPLPKKKKTRHDARRKEKFLLPQNVLKTVYKINEYPCRNVMDFDPYQTPNCPYPTRYGTCKEQEGTSQSDILPSLYGQWQIRLVNNHPDYEKQMKDVNPPNIKKLGALSPDSRGVQLKAQVTVCESPEKPDTEKFKADDSTETGELENINENPNEEDHKKNEMKRKRREEDEEKDTEGICCKTNGKVWVKDPLTLEESCKDCGDVSVGATPVIGGYYCKLTDIQTPEIKKKKSANGKQLKTERTS